MFSMLKKFEQNVCNLLKVRHSLNFAGKPGSFSTGFSTIFVEKFESPFELELPWREWKNHS
jgi:hypothetical protein